MPATGPGPCIIRAEHIGVYYRLRRKLAGTKKFWAVRDVSFEVRQGETLGVLGSNGAGKSTLMRVLAGIVAVDRGRIYRDPRFSVSLLSLGVGFEINLTGRQNAILSGMLLGMHRAEIEQRLDRVRDFAELGEFSISRSSSIRAACSRGSASRSPCRPIPTCCSSTRCSPWAT